jgi:hypothetical protein
MRERERDDDDADAVLEETAETCVISVSRQIETQLVAARE